MRYRRIDVRMWGDEKFRSLSPLAPSGQALFIYLLTTPNTTVLPGLYRSGAAAIAEELGWSIEDLKRTLDELIQQNLIKVDLKSRVIFIPNMIKYNKPESPNVVTHWASHWDEIPECELKSLGFQKLKQFVEDMSKAFKEAFREAFDESTGKPIPRPSRKTTPNQEQKQKQFQKKKQHEKQEKEERQGEEENTK